MITSCLTSKTTIHLAVSVLISTGTASRGAGPRLAIVGESNRVRIDRPRGEGELGRELVGWTGKYIKAGTIGYCLTFHSANSITDGVLDLYRELVFATDAVLVLLELSDVYTALSGHKALLGGRHGEGEVGNGSGDECGSELHFVVGSGG